MTTTTITNEMIYEVLKEFKEDTKRNFYQVDKCFEQVERRLDRVEYQQSEDRKILMDLWHHKDNMELKLSKSLLAVTGILSGGISLTVSVLTNTFLKR